MNKIVATILFAILVTSCIPNKDLVYFQGEPLVKEEVYKLNTAPYKLQTGDILSITIKSEKEDLVKMFNSTDAENQQFNNARMYFTGYSIDQYGNIRLPYIGEVNVLGYTTEEVREKVEIELRKFINYKNSIYVSAKLAGIRYTTLGEVNSPGTNIIYQNQLNIVEAISNAGDILATGDRKNIEVVRNEFDGIKKYKIDLTAVDTFDAEGFHIRPNDIIYVRPIKRKSWGIGTTGLETFRTISTVFSVIATTILLIKTL